MNILTITRLTVTRMTCLVKLSAKFVATSFKQRVRFPVGNIFVFSFYLLLHCPAARWLSVNTLEDTATPFIHRPRIVTDRSMTSMTHASTTYWTLRYSSRSIAASHIPNTSSSTDDTCRRQPAADFVDPRNTRNIREWKSHTLTCLLACCLQRMLMYVNARTHARRVEKIGILCIASIAFPSLKMCFIFHNFREINCLLALLYASVYFENIIYKCTNTHMHRPIHCAFPCRCCSIPVFYIVDNGIATDLIRIITSQSHWRCDLQRINE